MVHHNPGEPPFVTKFNDPAVLKSWGYNGQVIKTFPQTALTYGAFDPELVPPGSPQRAWCDKTGAAVDKKIAEAKAAGLAVFNFTDVLVVPESLLVKYGDEMTVGNGTITKAIIEKNRKEGIHGSLDGTGRRLSVLRPMTQQVMRVQIAELFQRFPDLTGIFIRFGETYLHDTPFHVGGSPVGGGEEEHRVLINLLREEVCVKRGKLLFYRTWGWDGFLTKPAFYRSVTDAIEPHPNLVFSIKHTQGDFTRDVGFNPTLGIGKHRQLVEVSCNQAGLYGKNAWPYYIGKGVIDGWKSWGAGEGDRGLRSLVGNPQFAGVWTWTRGDGWAGPYIPKEFWVDLNAYVINRFGQNPNLSEEEIFNEYARERLKLDGEQAAKFRELCLLATAATYHGQESSLFKSNSWWCRDEYLTAIKLQAVVDGGIAEQVLQEKAKAVADWQRVERMAREISLPNAADQEFLEVSSSYGRVKMAISAEIWTMQILAAQAKKSGSWDIARLSRAIQRYDERWREWRQLKQNHDCCPTLYRDDRAIHWGPPFKHVLDEYRKRCAEAGKPAASPSSGKS